ncbi:hypothetical protein LTR56_002422 [Elasticomyces elasticus]|nr:hypothetical protein LTR56_002422 [Elasticomyces elasticus]KAK3665986.1 hypothetical protein LTR22_003305 [Elasticomyces elasticus]KAK4929458.1 hypothetical protein LTR49_004062 [Elasticomyces elasticus]KAK5744264.1 hypothetical protein LTS12_023581 [Elasticomyces elasticus]
MSDALRLWRRRPLIVHSPTGQHLSILENAPSQLRDSNAYQARPLKFWIPPLDLMYSSPLSTLPGELLDAILSHIENSERVCLQQTSRHLYNSILANANDLDGTQRARLARVIKRQRYGSACEAEAAGVSLGGLDLDRQRGCWVCADVHSVTWFSDEQLAMPPNRRECVFSQRRIVLCKHKSITLVDIKKLQESSDQRKMDFTCKHCSDVSDGGAEEQKALDGMILEVQPLPTQTNSSLRDIDIERRHLATRTSELVLRHNTSANPHSAVAITRIRFDANVFQDVKITRYTSRSDPKSGIRLWKKLLRARFAGMGVWMCPHLTTADSRVSERFDGALWAAVRDQRSGRLNRVPTVERCGVGRCGMGFWFCRDELVDVGGRRLGIWKMSVRHCELVLPVVGADREWLACSVA